MKRTQKLVAICLLMVFLMACNCNLLNLIKNASGLAAQSTEGSSDSQANDGFTASGNSSTQTTEEDASKAVFNQIVPAKVKMNGGVFNIPQNLTLYDSTIESYKSFFVLENTSTDPEDIISEFTYKISWYGENGQVVDEWENTNNFTNLLPQEKMLFYLSPDKTKAEATRITSVVFEVTDFQTRKMNADPEWLVELDRFTVTHPIVSVDPGDFTFDYYTLLFDPLPRVSANVEVHSSLTVQAGVQVVGLFENAQGELIGVGESDPVLVEAGATASSSIASFDISEEPVKAEYFAQIVGESDAFDVAYPDMFK